MTDNEFVKNVEKLTIKEKETQSTLRTQTQVSQQIKKTQSQIPRTQEIRVNANIDIPEEEEDNEQTNQKKKENVSKGLKSNNVINAKNFQNNQNTQNTQYKKTHSKKIKSKRTYDEYIMENNPYEPEDELKLRSIKILPKGERTILTETEAAKAYYNTIHDADKRTIRIQPHDIEFFGRNDRYSKRIRIPRLNHLAGERIIYTPQRSEFDGIDGHHLKNLVSATAVLSSGQDMNKFRGSILIGQSKPKVKKRLVKGLKKPDPIEEEESNLSEEDDENLNDSLPEKYSDSEDEDGRKIIKISPESQKGLTKNMNVYLKCEIVEPTNNHIIIIGEKTIKNLKKGESFEINPLEKFSFKNHSHNSKLVILMEIIDKIKPSNKKVK
jgi:hypothetical protein